MICIKSTMELSKGFVADSVKINLNFDADEWKLYIDRFCDSENAFAARVTTNSLVAPRSEITNKLYEHLFKNSTVRCRCGVNMYVSKKTRWSSPNDILKYDCMICSISLGVHTLDGHDELMFKVANNGWYSTLDRDESVRYNYRLNELKIPNSYKQIGSEYVFIFDSGYYLEPKRGFVSFGTPGNIIEQQPIKSDDLKYLCKLIPKSD